MNTNEKVPAQKDSRTNMSPKTGEQRVNPMNPSITKVEDPKGAGADKIAPKQGIETGPSPRDQKI